MHELSIALRLVDVAAAEAARHPGKVTAVCVRVGALAGVVTEALRAAWEAARLDTPLAEAELIVEDIPAIAYCPACQTDRPLVSLQQWNCARCGQAVSRLVRGRELEMVALEIDP